MTNNLKAERTLTALNHVARVEHALGEAMHGVHNSQEWGEAWTGVYADGHHSYAAWIEAEFAELKAAIQSLSTQQPMGEVTNEMQIEALRLLKAHDEREDKVQEILEDLREIVLLMPAASRPEGLMKQAQAAVYAMRGRTRLMDDEAITAALHPNQESGE